MSLPDNLFALPTDRPSEPSPKPRRGKEPQATTLVRLARERWRFALDDTGRPFAVPLDGSPIAKPLDGTRSSLRTELAALHHAETGVVPTRSALADALAVIDGWAAEAGREPLHLRSGTHAGRLVIDLGDETGRCVVIGPRTVDVERVAPIVFRRTELTGALPVPEQTDDIGRLAELVNVTPGDLPLLVGWCLAAWLDIPRPILLLTGEQGSGKSSAAKVIAQLIDPSPAPLRAAPRDIEAWVVAAAGSQVVAVDNISHIPEWFSDALCRAATGEGLVRRALYTDSALSVLSFRRAVILTAIDAGALRGDLGERLVPVELSRITPDQRRTDADLDAALRDAAPAVFGALTRLAADALAALPSITLDTLPRMADFARLLAAVDAVTGWASLPAYLDAVERVAADVVASDPVAAAIIAVMDGRSGWSGTASDLLRVLDAHRVDGPGWPKTPRTLSGQLLRLAPALRGQGLEVTRERTESARTITIRAITAANAMTQHDANDANDAVPSVTGWTKRPIEPF